LLTTTSPSNGWAQRKTVVAETDRNHQLPADRGKTLHPAGNEMVLSGVA
jgi:hypothetical protein